MDKAKQDWYVDTVKIIQQMQQFDKEKITRFTYPQKKI